MASAMRGAKSEGNKSAKGMLVVRRRAVIRGASSARGIAKTKSVVGGGGCKWVKEWTSMGFVGDARLALVELPCVCEEG